MILQAGWGASSHYGPDFGFYSTNIGAVSPAVVAVPGTSGYSLTRGAWHHMALTFTGNNAGGIEKLFINGVMVRACSRDVALCCFESLLAPLPLSNDAVA